MMLKMGWRWYGEGNDPVSLNDIRQIPGVTSIVWALHHKMPGEIWTEEEIEKEVNLIKSYGFDADVVESVNVHDDIKIGLPTRDALIENYKVCIRNLGKYGVKVICYNFMPIFDWTRTDLFHPVGDGSTALFYDPKEIKGDYKSMAEYIMSFTEKYNMTFPGWEPERMAKLDELFKAYAPVTKEQLWENLFYFLRAIMPTCEEAGIKMAIHMDDPPWDIFGLPRLMVDEAACTKLLTTVDHPCNCLTLCTGSLNANPDNNCADIIRKHCDRIAFGHVRNIHHFEDGSFSEAAHRDCCGETGIIEVMRAYYEGGFTGYIRPDHGRQLWEEGPGVCRPGYGKYDRALGIQYMMGIWDLLERLDGKS
ncbi:MAG: mannonate dehydratase [Oscillospiraceae bacterium]|nr:mannonate dehydratase [Oscillospiraceae bacterium]